MLLFTAVLMFVYSSHDVAPSTVVVVASMEGSLVGGPHHFPSSGEVHTPSTPV